MLTRVRGMAAGGETWDLSDNDRAALRFVLALADAACDAAQEKLTPERYAAYLAANADAARSSP